MAPVSEPPVNQVSFPAPFSAVPCHWWDGGKTLTLNYTNLKTAIMELDELIHAISFVILFDLRLQ